MTYLSILDALRGLVPFLQFKKREKHSWRSATFSKVAECFSRFSSIGVFYVFKVVQMVPNRAKHRIYQRKKNVNIISIFAYFILSTLIFIVFSTLCKINKCHTLIFMCIYLSIYLSFYIIVYLFVYVSIWLSFYLSVCLSIFLSPSIYLCNMD